MVGEGLRQRVASGAFPELCAAASVDETSHGTGQARGAEQGSQSVAREIFPGLGNRASAATLDGAAEREPAMSETLLGSESRLIEESALVGDANRFTFPGDEASLRQLRVYFPDLPGDTGRVGEFTKGHLTCTGKG